MCEIIHKWLSAKLGIILDLKTVSFGEVIKDGALLAQLLHNYGVINTATLNSICKTDDSNIALKNLKVLNDAFKHLGVVCKEKDLVHISRGHDSPTLKLLYQLYLKLYNKNEVYFIINQEDIQKEKDEKQDEKPLKRNYFNLYKSTKDDLKWYEQKYAQIAIKDKKATTTCDKLENIGLNKIQHLKDSKNLLDDKFQLSYFANVQQPKEIVPSEPAGLKEDICGPDFKKARQFVAFLKKKHNKMTQNNKLSGYVHKMLLDDIMSTVTKKEENEIKAILTEKLMEQTQEEKKMAAKKLEIQAQKNIMLQNKELENQLFMEKCMEEVREQFYRQEHNISMEQKRYKMEEERILELHRRLYSEKVEREHRENCEACLRVYEDLVDLAIKVAEYRLQYTAEVPRRDWIEWKKLFCLEQPIFDICQDLEDTIAEEAEESKVLAAESCRQNVLDEQDMFAYLNLFDPWEIDTSLYESNIDLITQGLNILGFVVHRLLLTKYPVPKYPSIPELPSVAVAGSLNGVVDDLVLSILQEVLDRKSILLITINEAINYCLERYHDETTADVDKVLEEETKHVPEPKEKPHKKEHKPKGKKNAPKKVEVVEKPDVVAKETQTPNIFPGDEINLTRPGQLGKYVYETFNLGLTLNNFLLVQVLVEYLKTLKGKGGWVLINYPENINDAVIFELILSGKYEINKEYLDSDVTYINDLTLAEREDLFKPLVDKYEKKRLSNLLPNTLPARETPASNSYLTSYVYLIKNVNPSMDLFAKSIECIDLVQEFYTKFGCNTSITYKELDATTIKNIVAAIMKDEVFANEMYETVIQSALKAAQEKEERERLAKQRLLEAENQKGKKKAGKAKGKKKGKDKESSKHSSLAKESTSKHHHKVPVEAEEVKEPEKEEERYVDLHIPQDYQITLATRWENIEEIYTNDFKQFFFSRRCQNNSVAPYCQQVTMFMIKLIDKPDKKQFYLHQFQTFYNSIETDLLQDDEIKVELSSRIEQFRSILWNISYQHMRDCDDARIVKIKENWFCKSAREVVNLFISAMQLEMERCIRTLQLLEDYYVMMASHEVLHAKFYNSMLHIFNYDESNKGIEHIQNAFKESNVDLKTNLFTEAINNTFSSAVGSLTKTHQTTMLTIKRFDKEHEHGAKGKKTKKGKGDASAVHPTEDSKKNALLIKEWKIACEGEFLRAKLRLTVIHSRAVAEIEELLEAGQNLFQDIYQKINTRYHQEISNAKKACAYFRKAVEACVPLVPQLVFRGTTFEVNTNVRLVDDIPDIPECAERLPPSEEFSMMQLVRLFNIFSDLAPSSYLATKSFIYLLEDMVTSNSNSELKPLLPDYWTDLEPEEVSQLVSEIYGEAEFVNWKEFLIFVMEIPFPTESEILEVLQQFQKVDLSREQFVNKEEYETVQFWFENDCDISEERTLFFKKILRCMFTVDGCINYSDLLLSFCKDTEAVVGFTKALELCLGRYVCWNPNIGKRFLEFLRKEKKLDKSIFYNAVTVAYNNNLQSSFIDRIRASPGEQLINEDAPRVHDEMETDKPPYYFGEHLGEEEEECYCFDRTVHCPMIYFLTFDVILNVFISSAPWYCKFPCLEDKHLKEYLKEIYDNLRNEHFDNHVLAHEFLNNESFKKLLKSTNKFIIKSPSDIVMKLKACVCKEEEELTEEEIEDEIIEEELESEEMLEETEEQLEEHSSEEASSESLDEEITDEISDKYEDDAADEEVDDDSDSDDDSSSTTDKE